MWILIILFLPFAILLVSLEENIKNKNNKKEYKELSETIDNLENECKEINELISKIEEISDKETEYHPNREEITVSSYYDDSVSEEEIQQALEKIQDDKLTDNEIIFLKFMNNKKIGYTFSPRWEFQYDIKPRIEIAKLIQLEYLTYSSWYDNVKNATMKELKEILKKENLKVSGNKQELIERALGNIDIDLLEKRFNEGRYILTNKGIKVVEENKVVFMSDREKAGDEFAELTDTEYNQLQIFHKLNKYKQLKNNELSFKKGYKKNDILWSIYNMQALEYLNKKDYVMASVVYDSMHNLLYSEKRYEKALDFLICCLYMRVYEILPSNEIICYTDYYERQLKKYMNNLRDLLKKNDINIEIFDNRYKFIMEYIKVPIQMYLQHWYEFEKVNKFQQKINKFLDT